MIDAAVKKLAETMLYVTISFVVVPGELTVHQKFAEKLALIQKPSEPFGYVEYSFSRECIIGITTHIRKGIVRAH